MTQTTEAGDRSWLHSHRTAPTACCLLWGPMQKEGDIFYRSRGLHLQEQDIFYRSTGGMRKGLREGISNAKGQCKEA